MEFVDLKVERRTGTGKSVARKLRQGGRIPAIVYGEGAPIPVAADPKSLLKALRTEAGENVILNLTIVDTEEVTRKAMVKGVQVDPVTGIVLHAEGFIDGTRTFEMVVTAIETNVAIPDAVFSLSRRDLIVA